MTNGSGLKTFVEKFRKYNKPIWMTEFCYDLGQNPSVESHRRLMCDVLNYFETDPLIERYAWFMYDAPNNWSAAGLRPKGNNKGELTNLGKIYNYFSSMDKNRHYGHNEAIPAEHYSNCNASETAGNAKFTSSVYLNVSSDETGILEVNNFGLPKWLEYKINPANKGEYQFIIRYASQGESAIKISVDNTELGEIVLPSTGSYTKWETITSTKTFSIESGNHTVRITPSKGSISMNWWRYKSEK
jgi:hypothetical protein